MWHKGVHGDQVSQRFVYQLPEKGNPVLDNYVRRFWGECSYKHEVQRVKVVFIVYWLYTPVLLCFVQGQRWRASRALKMVCRLSSSRTDFVSFIWSYSTGSVWLYFWSRVVNFHTFFHELKCCLLTVFSPYLRDFVCFCIYRVKFVIRMLNIPQISMFWLDYRIVFSVFNTNNTGSAIHITKLWSLYTCPFGIGVWNTFRLVYYNRSNW